MNRNAIVKPVTRLSTCELGPVSSKAPANPSRTKKAQKLVEVFLKHSRKTDFENDQQVENNLLGGSTSPSDIAGCLILTQD